MKDKDKQLQKAEKKETALIRTSSGVNQGGLSG